MNEETSRYELVSRRAMLKASAGLGIAIVLPAACGNGDATVFAGAATDPVAGLIPTTAPVVPPAAESAGTAEGADPTPPPQPTAVPPDEVALDEPTPPPTALPTVEPTAPPAPTATAVPQVAVAGEMVISFTYTQGVGGKNERPYIAVWIEDAAGELATTISLWYQQERRGERWLDHLDRWYEVDQARQVQGGVDAVTVSSATRQAGSHAVAWDGTIAGTAAAPGSYFVCIEAAREEGPYSLIREPVTLTGTLAEMTLPDDGELSAATVRIDV